MVKTTNKFKLLAGSAALACFLPRLALATEIDTNIAQMQAMDKITGKVSVIEVPVNGSVNFGSFSILVRACKTRPPEDTPENFAFVDVVDNYNSQTPVNIFRGWMISSSPALNPVEHPIYDVWLLKCINGKVNPSSLLSKEELAARDALPKAPAFSDEDKLKDNEDASVKPNVPEKTPAKENAAQAPVVTPAPATQSLPEIAETELQNHNISNPPAVMAEPIAPEPIIEEDGAPKSLLNIGNEIAPQPEDVEAMPAADLPSEANDGKAQNLLPQQETPAQNENSAPVKEEKSSGFLDNFLSFGDEPKAETPALQDAPKAQQPADANSDSILDAEIDEELEQLQ